MAYHNIDQIGTEGRRNRHTIRLGIMTSNCRKKMSTELPPGDSIKQALPFNPAFRHPGHVTLLSNTDALSALVRTTGNLKIDACPKQLRIKATSSGTAIPSLKIVEN